MNEKNIYFIGLAISVLLIILSIYCCPFCAAILSGVGCSGVAATVMAYFLERASAKRKADRLKNARYVYFQSLNNQISMLIGRTLWFYYRLVDETFNWSLQDDKYFTVSYQLEARRRYQDIHSSFDVAISYSSNFLSDCYRRCLSGNYRCIMSMIFNERKKRAFPFMVSCANTVPGMLLTVTSWLLYNPTSLNASPVLRKLFREEQGNCALSLL